MKTYRIHLIRHGTTQGNIDGIYCGSTDIDLASVGVSQLQNYFNDDIYPGVKRIYRSPMKRCFQTAEIIFPNRETVVVDDLREVNFGDFEGRAIEELKLDAQFRDWIKSQGKLTPPNGESNQDFSTRILLAFDGVVTELLRDGVTDAAIVTHGGVIMNILGAMGLPKKPAFEWAIGNAKGYTVRVTPTIYMREKLVEVVSTIPLDNEEDMESHLSTRMVKWMTGLAEDEQNG